MTIKVLVCGGRDYNDREFMYKVLDELVREGNHYTEPDSFNRKFPTITIIHGNAKGADKMAGDWANDRGSKQVIFPANWNTHGKGVGHIRNQEMLDKGTPDVVIAFPGTAGTKSMIAKAKRAGVQVVEVG
ncbi:Mycobacteriophage D29, Gp61 [uncultured Caudovirales phage]|uniref:Mycobacteriophage D29, Gp61 n=1 Tax=uncultured Caudovirales phage TaxID=2100421 RepID=A0A6J5M5V2_9CAUD|nr:Mycobacteriophage D29, Gp61 [uncultured Caudovirales phage]